MTQYNIKCDICDGKGSYYMERDLHRSGGIVPCPHCNKGYITKDQYNHLNKERKKSKKEWKARKQTDFYKIVEKLLSKK
jgi:hypothetical protein